MEKSISKFNMIDLYFLKLDKTIQPDEFNRLFSLVSIERQHKINKLRNYSDKCLSLCSELLLRYLLRKRFQIKEWSLITNSSGKPYLENITDIYFNFSHSQDMILIGLSNSEIGTDIEYIKAIDIDPLIQYFTEQEIMLLNKVDGQKRLELFYELWVLKESFIKALGMGLNVPLNSFALEYDNGRYICIKDQKTYYLKAYDINKEYKAGVCSFLNIIPDRLKEVKLPELL